MKGRRRKAPVSSLRARLSERMREKEDWTEFDDDFQECTEPFFLVALFKQMHRFIIIKVTVAVAVVLVAALLYQGDYPWGRPVLDALKYVTRWDLSLESVTDKAVPAFRSAWKSWDMPGFQRNQDSPGSGVLPPVAGILQCGYGLRENPLTGYEEMHYGIDFLAAAGTTVMAVLDGQVGEIIAGRDRLTVVLEHHSGWQTVYRGLGDVAVDVGETVTAGKTLGRLGEPCLYEQPHLHFELRWKGRPVEPPPEWVALFEESAV